MIHMNHLFSCSISGGVSCVAAGDCSPPLKLPMYWVLWITGCTKWWRKLKRIWNIPWLIPWDNAINFLSHTHTRQPVIGWEWTPSPLSSLFCTNQMEITAHTHSGLFSEEMTHNSIARASVWVCVFVCLHILTWLDSLCVCLHGLKEREHGEQAPPLSWCVIMIISSHRLSVPAY